MYFGPTHHRLRISLDDVEPEVWRTLVVASDTPLPELAQVLLAAMGWEGHHLHQFLVAGMSFGPGDVDMSRFTIPDEQVTLEQIAREATAFEWQYDFGDSWSHHIAVEWVGEPEQAQVPVCLDGARACPPEDCGGPPGYDHLMEVLADPSDEEHADMMEWVGGGFDPESFDLRVVNERLRFLRRNADRR